MILEHVDKPWGYYETLYEDVYCKIKILVFNPGKRMSLQYHKHRAETWRVLEGEGIAEIDGRKFCIKPGMTIGVPLASIHRLTALAHSKKPLRIVEIQTGESFEEDDLVRLESDYHDLNKYNRDVNIWSGIECSDEDRGQK